MSPPQGPQHLAPTPAHHHHHRDGADDKDDDDDNDDDDDEDDEDDDRKQWYSIHDFGLFIVADLVSSNNIVAYLYKDWFYTPSTITLIVIIFFVSNVFSNIFLNVYFWQPGPFHSKCIFHNF